MTLIPPCGYAIDAGDNDETVVENKMTGGNTMSFNPIIAQLIAEERRKDVMRQNEQTRLLRTVTDSGKLRRWSLIRILASNRLLPRQKQAEWPIAKA